MQLIKGILQGSPEWLELRKGMFTASNAQAIASNGKGLETYVNEVMSDYYATVSDFYINPDMERGNELEASARLVYEMETGNTVEEVTFIKADEHTGCSPDGLVGEEGLLEIKCPNNKNYFLINLDKKYIDTKYVWQMQMQMYVSGRKWCDYIAYNPHFDEERNGIKHFVIYRFEADTQAFEKIEAGLKTCIEKKLEIMKLVEQKKKGQRK